MVSWKLVLSSGEPHHWWADGKVQSVTARSRRSATGKQVLQSAYIEYIKHIFE